MWSVTSCSTMELHCLLSLAGGDTIEAMEPGWAGRGADGGILREESGMSWLK
jgi:hypothetical protein